MRYAKIISYLTHPIFTSTLLLAYVLFQKESYVYYSITPAGRIMFLILSILLTIGAPVSSIAYLVYKKQVENYYLYHRKERIIPMAITVAYTFGLFYILQRFNLPRPVMATMGVAVIGVASTLIITLFWKISAHMMGIAGITGVVLALSQLLVPAPLVLILLLFILTGMVGTARLIQNSHNLRQILVGWVLGFSISYVSMFYLVDLTI